MSAVADHDLTQQHPSSVFDKAICLSVELKKPSYRRAADLNGLVKASVRKTLDASEVEGSEAIADHATLDADDDMLSFGKKLIDCEELREINHVDTKVRNMLKKYCLASPLRSGVYLLPIDLIETVDAKLEELKQSRDEKVARFLEVYPDRIEEARERLGSQFNQADYHDVTTLRDSYQVVTQYFTFGVPGQLKGVSKAIFDRAKEEATTRWNEASEQIQAALREAMSEMVSHMVDRLTPGPDGARKMFCASSLDKLSEFMETFKSRNITDDTELEELVDKARELLSGADPKKFRTDGEFRETIRNQFEDMKQKLNTMMVDAPKRKFRFYDE